MNPENRYINVGDLIEGRFEIERPAGYGGFAAVYRAIDRDSGEPVAIKILQDPDNTNDRRFRHEDLRITTLRHPHLVRYVAHGFTEGGAPYIAMEWLDGWTLQEELSRGPLSIVDAMRLAACIADALNAVHAAGIVHSNLNPSNIFLPNGQIDEAKLLGFNIAQRTSRVSRLTSNGKIIGTPAYMAPEQLRGEGMDDRADIFALGVVLFECLTSRSPFEGHHVMAILAKVLFEPVPQLHDLRPEVPPALNDIVAQLLAKDPNERPSSGLEVRRALEPLLEVEGRSQPKDSLCLNAWFPDQSGDKVRIPVGAPARLCVNLGPPEQARGPGASSTLEASATAHLELADHADVLVLCPGARVLPLRRRLSLPPAPAHVLEFSIIPLRADHLEIEIVLLVQNEPIHRMSFWVRAEPADTLLSMVAR